MLVLDFEKEVDFELLSYDWIKFKNLLPDNNLLVTQIFVLHINWLHIYLLFLVANCVSFIRYCALRISLFLTSIKSQILNIFSTKKLKNAVASSIIQIKLERNEKGKYWIETLWTSSCFIFSVDKIQEFQFRSIVY